MTEQTLLKRFYETYGVNPPYPAALESFAKSIKADHIGHVKLSEKNEGNPFRFNKDNFEKMVRQKNILKAQKFLEGIDKSILTVLSHRKSEHEKTMKKYSIIKLLRDHFELTFPDIAQVAGLNKQSVRFAYENAEYTYHLTKNMLELDKEDVV